MRKLTQLTLLLSLVCSLLINNSLFAQRLVSDPKADAGGEVTITLAGVPPKDASTISRAYAIDRRSGTIRLPYLKSPLRVQGRTPRQIEDLITRAYVDQKIFSQPIVSAKIMHKGDPIGQRFIHLTGYIGAKKNMLYREGITLIEAIIDCGDISDFGSRYIQVTRKGVTRKYDYFSAKDRSIVLYPGDMIHVPRRTIFESRPDNLLP